MREIRTSGSEGGVRLIPHPYPISERRRGTRSGEMRGHARDAKWGVRSAEWTVARPPFLPARTLPSRPSLPLPVHSPPSPRPHTLCTSAAPMMFPSSTFIPPAVVFVPAVAPKVCTNMAQTTVPACLTGNSASSSWKWYQSKIGNSSPDR